MSAERLEELEEELEQAYELVDELEANSGGHEDTEGVWLISYADLMTLLMGFFALLTSMADFNEEKFADAAAKVAEYTGGEVEQPFEKVGESIKDVIKEKQLEDQVNVEVKPSSITISFTGTLLFSSGSYGLKEEASALMDQIAEVLEQEASDKKVLIEGHTDDVPINRGVIASNWELSSLRANAVARLLEQHSFKSTQILTIGWGDTRPLVPHRDEAGNAIAENQAKNRRVILKLANKHPL